MISYYPAVSYRIARSFCKVGLCIIFMANSHSGASSSSASPSDKHAVYGGLVTSALSLDLDLSLELDLTLTAECIL